MLTAEEDEDKGVGPVVWADVPHPANRQATVTSTASQQRGMLRGYGAVRARTRWPGNRRFPAGPGE